MWSRHEGRWEDRAKIVREPKVDPTRPKMANTQPHPRAVSRPSIHTAPWCRAKGSKNSGSLFPAGNLKLLMEQRCVVCGCNSIALRERNATANL